MAFDDDTVRKKTPLQVLNKSPNYFRRNVLGQPQKRSLSAAEQLFEGRQVYATAGQNSSDVINRLEYFNKNKKGLLDDRSTVTRRDAHRKQIQDDSLIVATRRGRKEVKERMHRARSVERPPVQKLVITSFSSDESDDGDEIPSNQKDDSVTDIPFGRVLNRISFFSNRDFKKPSAIIYQDVKKEPVYRDNINVSIDDAKTSNPQKPPKLAGVCYGKENQKEDSNTIESKIEMSVQHIKQKSNDDVNNRENKSSFGILGHERPVPRRVIEQKPLFHIGITTNFSLQHKDKFNDHHKSFAENGIGNSVLCSAKSRLAKNENNAIQAVAIDIPQIAVNKPTCAERLGVQPRQQRNDGDRRIVASHSFHYFPPDGTSSNKNTSEILRKSFQNCEGFVKRHVRQRSAPDATIKGLINPETTSHKNTDSPEVVSKDDNSIQKPKSYSEDWQRNSAIQVSTSYAKKLGIHSSTEGIFLKTEKKSPETTQYIPTKKKEQPVIPEKPKKPIVLKKPLYENALKRIENKNVMKSSRINAKKTDVPVRTVDCRGVCTNEGHKLRTTRKPEACTSMYGINPSSSQPDINEKCTKSDTNSESYKDLMPTDGTIRPENNGGNVSSAGDVSIELAVPQSRFTKQYKQIKFQPRRKSSDLLTSTSVVSETSNENVNGKQKEDLCHERLNHGQKVTSQIGLDENILEKPCAGEVTFCELEKAVKSTDDNVCMPGASQQQSTKLSNDLKQEKIFMDLDVNSYEQDHTQSTKVFNENTVTFAGANKSKSSMKPFTSSLRHKPYEYSTPLNTDWTGSKTKQYASIAPPTTSQLNPECSVEKAAVWSIPINEYSTEKSKPTDRNILVFDCANVHSIVDQEGRIKQYKLTDQDSSLAISHIKHQHKKSYSSLSQSEYGQESNMDRLFRPVVKRVNSWNDHISRERRRDKDSKELYKKALKENKQKIVLNQQCKKVSTSEIKRQENKYTAPNEVSNVQLCNTKNVDNSKTAKELLILRTENLKTYRTPVEGNNNQDFLKKEQTSAKVIDVDSSVETDNQKTQCNVQSDKTVTENELRTRQASVDEVHEALARLNSSKNSSSPSVCSNRSPGITSQSIATSDISRDISPLPTSYKKVSPDSVFVDDAKKSELISTESVVEETLASVLKHEERSAMKVRRNSKELFVKQNIVIKKEKPQFLDLKNEEKTVVTDTGSNYNSLKRKQHLMRRNSWGSSSDVSVPQLSTPSRRNSLSELDTFFEQMGLDDNVLVSAQSPHELDDVFHTMYMEALDNDGDSDVLSEGSRVSESGLTKKLKKIPDNTSSIITRNAKVIKWLCQCKKAKTQL